ncbi:hypothetical protein cypCar_00038510 [Cyprinus carpio]|nr:hypothetical protein cypCar_00038510 [Cyprinus carpio]
MSFSSFNPEVERKRKSVSRMETDITDEEMARRYESLVESMRKKFAKKRNRSTIAKSEEDVNCNVDDNQHKKVFLKPQD